MPRVWLMDRPVSSGPAASPCRPADANHCRALLTGSRGSRRATCKRPFWRHCGSEMAGQSLARAARRHGG
jgi:hypothetical protein